MATTLAPAAASSSDGAHFLLGASARGTDVAGALEAALVAERASNDGRRAVRARIAYLLCELGSQLRQQARASLPPTTLPLSRKEISGLLGVPLCKVKGVLALLCLSQAIRTDGDSIEVLDWSRLCASARVDPSRLNVPVADEDDAIPARQEEDEAPPLVTAAGEPACFV